METIKAIRTRRSIRKFLKKPVKQDLIIQIIDAARFSPSSGNLQNWKFIVVNNPEKIKQITTTALNQSWMNQAPVHIIVCNELTKIKRLYKERGEKLYSIQNCAAVTQTILLAAHSLGLGSCWVGAFDKVGLKRVLKIPDGVEPMVIIPIGYSFDKIFKVPHRHDLDQLTFFDEWGRREKSPGLFPISKHKGKVEEQTKGLMSRIKEKVDSIKEKFSNRTSNN